MFYKSKIGIRKTNEDKHTIVLNYDGKDQSLLPIDLFCIYDGHGGNYVSTILSTIIPNIFMDKRMNYPLYKVQVNKICNNIQKILTNNFNNKTKECGSTCLITVKYKYHDQNVLDFINIGDSRTILCRGTNAIQITNDHKPLYPNEKNRITKMGGKVVYDGLEWRVDNLSLSRSFGDHLSKYTPPIPDLFHHVIKKGDRFIVMACDGLWDVMDNQTVVNYVLHFCYDKNGNRINEKLDIADKLVQYALQQG